MESLPGNYILCLGEDRSQNIWIGTNNSGLARYNTVEQQIYRYEALPDDRTIPGNIIGCSSTKKSKTSSTKKRYAPYPFVTKFLST